MVDDTLTTEKSEKPTANEDLFAEFRAMRAENTSRFNGLANKIRGIREDHSAGIEKLHKELQDRDNVWKTKFEALDRNFQEHKAQVNDQIQHAVCEQINLVVADVLESNNDLQEAKQDANRLRLLYDKYEKNLIKYNIVIKGIPSAELIPEELSNQVNKLILDRFGIHDSGESAWLPHKGGDFSMIKARIKNQGIKKVILKDTSKYLKDTYIHPK